MTSLQLLLLMVPFEIHCVNVFLIYVIKMHSHEFSVLLNEALSLPSGLEFWVPFMNHTAMAP